jgi:phosphatidylinositol 3-kinase
MVDGMGGQDSEHYRRFETYCCEAFNILRKSAGLLISLFHLMAGVGSGREMWGFARKGP